MGSALQAEDVHLDRDYLGHENCVDVLVRTRPELVGGIHRSFLEAGSDAVETNTFGANELVFGEFGEELVQQTRQFNVEAAELARACCDEYSTADRPRFVFGSMGPGTKLISLKQVGWERMLQSYAIQAEGLIAGGADAFLIETCQDLLQVKCAINACLAALDKVGRTPMDVPIFVSVTIETTGTMLLGSHISSVVTSLQPYPISGLGLNCATGPEEMFEHMEYLSRHWDRFISVVPNAGLPRLEQGQTRFPLEPDPMATVVSRYIEELGVDVIGGCCGTTTEHIAALDRARTRVQRAVREPVKLPSCSSLYSAMDYRQENSFLIVGERMNASGSRKFKRLLEQEDWDQVISIGRDQVREGANVLDLNVDYAGRDNIADMEEIASRATQQLTVPMMIDSTQIGTIEAGLRHCGGKCIINSANFEDGQDKFDQICAIATTYGAALVIGSIDEDEEAAMARTADRKLEIARRGFARAVEHHGLDPADIFFDPLVLPISTGMEEDRRSGLELIEGTRLISTEFPSSQITCGLSNVSFGLSPAARVVLNSVFLDELIKAGMTSAIVHASKILPLARISEDRKNAALDLIYDRRHESLGGTGLPDGINNEAFDPLQAFVELFSGDEAQASDKVPKSTLTVEQRLRDHIIEGDRQDLEKTLKEALGLYTPLEIINDHLLDGMRVVGELFGSGQMQLPFVLQSAESMKAAVAFLEPLMDRVDGSTRGSIVLATVKGDVHDIGKNLVDIILSNNGFTVHNIGIKQPLSEILAEFERTGADAIGMSGLLVKSVMVMEENLKELNARGLKPTILLGGAALTRNYAEGHLRSLYDGPLYYGKDAFDGLNICEHIAAGTLGELDDQVQQRLDRKPAPAPARPASTAPTQATSEPGPLQETDVPSPPFLGSRVQREIDLDEIYPYINTTALFRGQWGFKRGSMDKEEYEESIRTEAEPVLERLKHQLKDEGVLRPEVVWGYFHCNSEGDDLLVYDPKDAERVIQRFSFPRQHARQRRCISDFFRPVDSGVLDVIGFHCVTMGNEVSRRARILFEDDAYQEYLFVHGMGVETAEALAELWHARIRRELGIESDDAATVRELFTQGYRGSRYSFGYPACPDMSDQQKLFDLIDPSRIGCVLTENWQIDPEQSTSAIIVHHPSAKYFNVELQQQDRG